MRTIEMRAEDVRLAVEWMLGRIRKKAGNDALNFPADWMPETGMAVLGEHEELLAVAALYLEKSSPVAVCGWCISNPANTPQESYTAVNLLMSVMPVYARNHGAKYLLTTFGDRGINRILDKNGYCTGDSDVQHKFMAL